MKDFSKAKLFKFNFLCEEPSKMKSLKYVGSL